MVVSAPPKYNNICEHKLNVGHKHKNFSSTFSLEKSKLNIAHIHHPKYWDIMRKGKNEIIYNITTCDRRIYM